MEQVIKYKTIDGKEFTSTIDAKRNLEKLEADLMAKIGHNLNHKKFTEVQDYIDVNLHLFQELINIRKDYKLDIETV